MLISNAGPMRGNRLRYGDFIATATERERDAVREEIAADVITDFAITPRPSFAVEDDDLFDWLESRITEDEFDAWVTTEGFTDALFGEADLLDEIDSSEPSGITDRDIAGGWGTHLDFTDLAGGFTITRTQYGYTKGES